MPFIAAFLPSEPAVEGRPDMRIGINTFALSSRLGMAGSGRYIRELVHALARLDHGHELILFANRDNWDLLPASGCERVDCGRLTINRPTRLAWEHAVLPLTARRYRLDVLHSPVFVAPAWLPCASVVSILDMTWFLMPEMHTRVKGAYFRVMIPRRFRRAARVIAISHATKSDIVRMLDIPDPKVVVTHLGVNLTVFQPNRANGYEQILEERYGVRRPYVLYVGKIEPRKNPVTLIEAFDRISDKFPDHHLVLAGNRGWDYEAVYTAAAAARHREWIRFTGFVSEADLPALYAGADLFVYPSSYEGFGFPVLEAMACGAPVITSNVSSLPEVAGDAALLVNPLDVGELAAAMERILSDPTLREVLRVRGLEQARRFTWEETARRTLQVYEEAYILQHGGALS